VDRWAEVSSRQEGVVHRRQALALGWSSDQIRHRVRRGAWTCIHPGVYLTHNGQLTFLARVWAALLHAGPPAMASHLTAGRLQGLVDEDPARIQISVPHGHRAIPQPGMRIHHPRGWALRRQPAASIPQTRIEDTVLDLVGHAADPEEVVRWVLRACQRRLTTPARLRAALAQRRRQRHRSLVKELVAEAAGGVASSLERRYRRMVEAAHGLPKGERGGAWLSRDGRCRYFDVRYKRWRVRVELEGLAYHPDDRSWVDHTRDNQAVLMGDVVLRYGWRPVVTSSCDVAAQVAAVLTLRGWAGVVKPCGPGCGAPRAASGASAEHWCNYASQVTQSCTVAGRPGT
jgi:hypothetical protein